MSRDTVKLLRKTSIFSLLDPNSLTKISEFFKEETYPSGHVFFRDDTVNHILYIIKHGAVKIIKTSKSGEGKLSLILRREGDFFGETALIEETSPLETAQAIKNTKVLQLSRSDFLTILSNHPFIAFQIMKALTSRLRQFYLGLIEDLGEKDEQLKKAYVELEPSARAQTKDVPYSEETVYLPQEIVFAFPFSIIATKEDGTISIFNKTAEREYGCSSDEAMGKVMDLLRGEGNLSNLDELIKHELENKGIWKGEIIAKRKNGERFISETTVYSIVNPKSTGPAILWVGRDVTLERVLAREALEKEKLLHTAERIKEVALKFRDVIQLLSENLDLLTYDSKDLNSLQSQMRIKTMKDTLDNLKGIIYSPTSFPTAESIKEPVNLANFIEKELLVLRPEKKFEGIEFVTKYDEKLPLLDVEQQQMRQLLSDLLDDAAVALKSVPDREKTITVEVRYLVRNGEIELQILDNGIGISEADLPNVFQEHFTTKGERPRFGLLSVKKTVENHSGTIEVQSVEGAYTLFTIRFPVKKQVPICEENPSLTMLNLE